MLCGFEEVAGCVVDADDAAVVVHDDDAFVEAVEDGLEACGGGGYLIGSFDACDRVHEGSQECVWVNTFVHIVH